LAIDPKATVETDIPSKTVKVSSELDNEKIGAAVCDAGYDVITIG
jgi:copper chaperone CopZ